MQLIPALFRAFRAEHGVSADQIEVGRKRIQEQSFGEFLDGEDVGEERAAAEALDGEGGEDGGGGDDGGAEEDDVGVLLAEVVGVGEEGDAEFGGGGGVVGAGVGEDGVALAG